MKANLLKKTIATTMVATMVIGSSMTALAEDVYTQGDESTGTGQLEGYVDPSIVRVTVPTVAEDTFDFKADPQQLIYKTVNSELNGTDEETGEETFVGQTAYKNVVVEQNATLLFKKAVAGTKTNAAKATYTRGGSALEDVTATAPTTENDAKYVYRETKNGWYADGADDKTELTITATYNDVAYEFKAGDKIVFGADPTDASATNVTAKDNTTGVTVTSVSGGSASTTYTFTYDAGWYEETKAADATAGTDAEYGDTKVTIAAVDEDEQTVPAQAGDIVTYTAATTEATSTTTYSSESAQIVATNKGLNDISVSVEAVVTPSKNIKINDDKTFEDDTTASIYLALKDVKADPQDDTIKAVKGETKDDVTTYSAKLPGTIGKLTENDINYTYDATKKVYSYVVKEDATPKTFTFCLTGAANPAGDWSKVDKDEAPTVKITWKFEDPAAAAKGPKVAFGTDGKIMISGLTAEKNYGNKPDSAVLTYDGNSYSLGSDTNLKWDIDNWSATDGGTLGFILSDAWLSALEGNKATVTVTLSDGEKITSEEVQF